MSNTDAFCCGILFAMANAMVSFCIVFLGPKIYKKIWHKDK
jgi:hypothetical protein